MVPDTDLLVRDYLVAKREVIDKGFADEIAWQIAVRDRPLTSKDFLREAAWVVLSAGMRETVIRKVFSRLDRALFEFDAELIMANRITCESAVMEIFGHRGKVSAIFEIVSRISKMEQSVIRANLANDTQRFLCSLPYIGPITWRHLAKNLGVDVAKADRHLVRIADATDRESVDILCMEIGDWLGESVSVVDVVLWRWSLIHFNECENTCESTLHV